MTYRTRSASHRVAECLTVVSLLFGCSGAQLDELEVADEAKRIQSLMLAMNIGSDGALFGPQSFGQEEQCRYRHEAEKKCKERGYTDPDSLNACASMIIADYGTGMPVSPYTFCGTMIGWIDRDSLDEEQGELDDNLRIALPQSFPLLGNMTLEALWGKDGVLCVENPRWHVLADNNSSARVGSCFKKPRPEPAHCDLKATPEDQYRCRKQNWYLSWWGNHVKIDQRKVIFASYTVPNENSLSLAYNEKMRRLQPTGAVWPLQFKFPLKLADCDFEANGCLNNLATAGILLRQMPPHCDIDKAGLCRSGSVTAQNNGEIKELLLWEKRDKTAVTDYVVSTATTPDASFDAPGHSIPGTWARAASLGYVYDANNQRQTRDEFFRNSTVDLLRVVHNATGKHFFATDVPPCGFSLVRKEGRMLKYPRPASEPSISEVLCQRAGRI